MILLVCKKKPTLQNQDALKQKPPSASPSSRIGAVHEGNFSRNFPPFHLSLVGLQRAPFLSEAFLPAQELVGEKEMRLDNDIEAARPDEAVRAGERQIQRSHDLRYADGGTT